MKDVIKEELGKEAKYDVKIDKGNIIVTVSYDGKGADAQFSFTLEGEYFLTKLKKAIPGEIDDAIINLLIGAFKAM